MPTARSAEAGRLGEEELDVVVADERASEPRGGESEERETGERREAVAGKEREHDADRSDECEHLSRVGVLHDGGRYA